MLEFAIEIFMSSCHIKQYGAAFYFIGQQVFLPLKIELVHFQACQPVGVQLPSLAPFLFLRIKNLCLILIS